MRIIIDMQAVQTGSRYRGIGRYAVSLANAMLSQYRDMDFWILLNDQNEEDLVRVRALFSGLIDPGKIVSFGSPHAVNEGFAENQWRVRAAELIRSHFIAEMEPDLVITTSLMEFDAVTSIEPPSNRKYKTIVIHHDLIPLAEPEVYLQNQLVRQWYDRKLKSLCNADLLLANSNYTLNDAIKRLGLTPSRCLNISAAADSMLAQSLATGDDCASSTVPEVVKNSVLYVGGFDVRKNVEKLIEAYSKLTVKLRETYPLVLVGKVGPSDIRRLTHIAESFGISAGNVKFPGYIPDHVLIDFYKECRLFVFPSSNEGFGLPPLEAMSYGVPVIAAARTSLIEVVGSNEALFDPDNIAEFSSILFKGITNPDYRSYLINNGNIQSKKFTWTSSAQKLMESLTIIFDSPGVLGCANDSDTRAGNALNLIRELERREQKLIVEIGRIKAECLPEEADLLDVAKAISKNASYIFSKITKEGQSASMSKLHKLLLKFKLASIDQASDFHFDTNIPSFDQLQAPYVFSSTLCRANHFRMPLYSYWCNEFRDTPRFHRKQWEFVFICQALFERGYLVPGKRALGFGVGREPLTALFASRGVSVLASDLDIENAKRLGWVSTNQHSDNQADLNHLGICDPNEFNRLVDFKNIDMNNIPADVGTFDFCWSSCAFEHLGSIRRGLDFVRNSIRILKPGGIAVHTTEYNVSSNSRTLDNNDSFVIFRRQDIELLISELHAENCIVEDVDFTPGQDPLEQYVDMPPYQDAPHLRLQLADEFTATSIGLIIRRLS
jgi:glycosyltransferase involved in cell wall biosynthesis/SAM-dependent methyltransferase